MMVHMSTSPVAIVTQTDTPGLVNVQVTTGEEFFDITLGQLRYLATRHGWQVVPAGQEDSSVERGEGGMR